MPLCVCVCVCVCVHGCVGVYVCKCACHCVCACLCVGVYVCMHVCIYVSVCVCWRERGELVSWLVSWCFKPSQPQRITSGLERGERLTGLSGRHERCLRERERVMKFV